MANNKNNALTEEERKRLLEEFAARQSEQKNKVNIVSSAPTVAQTKANMPDYITTGPAPQPAIAASRNSAGGSGQIGGASGSASNADNALKRFQAKTKSAVLAPEYEISSDALSGASPSMGDAVRASDGIASAARKPEDIPGVMRDHTETLENGVNKYYFGVLQEKINRGEAPTAADYLNAFTLMTVEAAEAQAARVKAMHDEYGSAEGYAAAHAEKSHAEESDNYYDYSPVEAGDSRENTRRTLDEIYNEYLEGAYYKNAVAEGKRLAEDVLGKYAAMTGGMPSTAATYAATAAGQQSDRAAQDYLWGLAQKQFRTEQDEQSAESEKYASMIDNYLKMGYGVNDIPDEWWAKSNYDKKYAGGVSEYVGRQNEAGGDEREFYSALLDKYVSGGYDVPDELYARAGYSDEQAAMLKNYVASLGAKNEGKARDEWATADYDSANKTADAVLKMYKSGQDWEGYLSSLDDATAEYIFEYLGRSSPASMRQWERSGKTFVDEFGNEYDESALRAALVRGGMNDKEASAFIKTIK